METTEDQRSNLEVSQSSSIKVGVTWSEQRSLKIDRAWWHWWHGVLLKRVDISYSVSGCVLKWFNHICVVGHACSSSIVDRLQTMELVVRQAGLRRVAVVQPTKHQWHDQWFVGGQRQAPTVVRGCHRAAKHDAVVFSTCVRPNKSALI